MKPLNGATGNEADVILKNGKVYTMDRRRRRAQALAVKGDRIVFIGSDDRLGGWTGPRTRVVDLEGKMVLPGFIDSHAHVSATNNETAAVNLSNLPSKAAYLAAVEAFAARHPQTAVIHGAGWKNECFSPRGPLKTDLDRIVDDRPVSLMSEDGHSIWTNSRAIRMAGVEAGTVCPKGGVIETDPINGEPSGTFRETARDLIENRLPPFSTEQLKGGIQRFMEEAAGVGITTVHDPLLLLPGSDGQLNGFGPLRNNILAFQRLADEKALSLRVRGTVLTDPSKDKRQIDAIARAASDMSRPWFNILGIKVFIDGVIEGCTAYLSRPYTNRSDTCGEPLWTASALEDLFTAADRMGLQIHIHAIGDAALSMALDALSHARRQNGPGSNRHLITHLYVVDRNDIPRMAQLDVIGVPQPFWHVKGDYFRDIELYFLGRKRAEATYPMQSFLNAGVMLAAASDYPVQVPSPPLLGIMLGMTRCEPGATDPTEILGPEERMSLEEMIASYTINGAYANYCEHETGSLEIGKKADLVVLEKDLFAIPKAAIADVRVEMTLFNGAVVFENP